MLPKRDRVRFYAITLIQMALSFLDLFGVILIGAVAALGIAKTQGSAIPGMVASLAEKFGISDPLANSVILTLAVLAGSILLLKTFTSFVLTRRLFHFLGARQAELGGRMAKAWLEQPMLVVTEMSRQETAYSLTTGINALSLRMLGNASTTMSELSLLVVMMAGLIFVDPVLTLVVVFFFGITGWVSHRFLSSLIHRLAISEADAEVQSMETIQNAIANLRTITVSGRRSLFAKKFYDLRVSSASSQADLQFLAQIPKFAFEAALVIGGFILCVVEFKYNDAASAIGSITLFLAAASRVTPSLLRLQGASLNMRGSSGTARVTIQMAKSLPLGFQDIEIGQISGARIADKGREGTRKGGVQIELAGVTYTYPSTDIPALSSINLDVPAGASIAFVGSTGCGKTTLADLVLGLLKPDKGSILIDGVTPGSLINGDPFSIGYVPQDVSLVRGSVRENVAIGIPRAQVEDDLVWDALERAKLADFLRLDRDGLDTEIGEHGLRLSGGQKQRLGIARSLYGEPRLLVMDEATSALDAQTESDVSDAIGELRGQVTIILIAHRLSTVQAVDRIIFMESGRIIGNDTFEGLRRSLPNFDRLVSLNQIT